VTPCENCHSSRGPGKSPQIPYLAGQYAHYIAFELDMWKRGYRKNSREIMMTIAERLDDQDISALAAYFQRLAATSRASASK
jgi:cytochrome c553